MKFSNVSIESMLIIEARFRRKHPGIDTSKIFVKNYDGATIFSWANGNYHRKAVFNSLEYAALARCSGALLIAKTWIEMASRMNFIGGYR